MGAECREDLEVLRGLRNRVASAIHANTSWSRCERETERLKTEVLAPLRDTLLNSGTRLATRNLGKTKHTAVIQLNMAKKMRRMADTLEKKETQITR